MFILKSVTFFLIWQLFIGLFILSPESPADPPIIKSPPEKISHKAQFSTKFYKLEYALLNQQINYSIDDSISSLQNNFEKEYLLSLVNTRRAEYLNSFNRLYKYLSTFPKHYQYYDQLIFNAKASGNLSKLLEFISRSKYDKNEYSDYLTALINYHLSQYSVVIKILTVKDEFNALYLLSFAYRGLADYQQSLDVLQRCKKKIDSASLDLPKVLVAQGSLFLLSGDYKNAEKIYNQAIQLADKFGNQKEKSKALINFAILDDQDGKTNLARTKLQLALSISRNIGNQEIEATVLSELGVSYTYTNEIVSARNNYEKSLTLYKVLNNQERLSNLSANIAAVFAQQGNYALALNFYNDGLYYASENIFSKILNLRGIGDVYANLSNYSQALEYYTQAKKLALKIKNINSEANLDISIGTLFYNINRPQKALKMFLDAKEKIDQNTDLYALEDINFKIGLAYSRIDSIKISNVFLHDALIISQSAGDIYYSILISTELAYNYYLERNFDRAENILLALLNKSRNSGLHQLESVQYLYLGKIKFEQKNLNKAITFFDLARNLADNVKDFNTYLAAEYFIGKCYESQWDFGKAEFHYKVAIETINKISESMINNSEIQISHFAGLGAPFNSLTELYIAQGKNEKALQIIEESRSRNTFQNLNNLLINSRIHNPDILKKYYDLMWQINSGIYSGDTLKSIQAEFKLISEQNFISQDKKESDALSISKVQSLLDKNENIITYFISDNSIAAFVISKYNFKVVKIPVPRNDLIKIISQISALYSEKINENDIYFNQDLFSFNAKYSNEFYNSVLNSVLSSIPENDKLIFSMPTEMALIPMEFLVTHFEKGDSPYLYENKKFLIEKYAISYTPSISIFMLQNKIKKTDNEKVLFIGDPQISNKDFAASYRGGLLEDSPFKSRSVTLFPLKYSRQEVEELSNMFSNKSVFLSKDATEENFKKNAGNSSIIHLSTHSFLYKDQPLIIFSQNQDKNNKEDGYLEAGEIHQLKLNSDLVVLSSCRSGIGSIDKAEGILGMQKSFFEVGAKSVVVSMWDVNDKYTSLFMQSFYKYLVDGYDKSEALRKAKIFFKQHYSANPYYWAAFVLSGNVSPIKINNDKNLNVILVFLFITLIVIISAYYFKIKQS